MMINYILYFQNTISCNPYYHILILKIFLLYLNYQISTIFYCKSYNVICDKNESPS